MTAARFWTAKRKAEVCRLIAAGDLAITDAMVQHDLTFAEVQDWLQRWAIHGLDGLKATRCQTLRPIGPIVAEIATAAGVQVPSPLRQEPLSPAGCSFTGVGEADSAEGGRT